MNGDYFQNTTLSSVLVVLMAIEQSKAVLDAHSKQISEHTPIKQIQSKMEAQLKMSQSIE